MPGEALDQYRLAGLDERERGFSRPVEFERAGETYRAILRYETTRIITESQPNQDAALRLLIHMLHEQGYRQLRTQLSFHNGAYLGAQTLWVDYPDPPESAQPSPGLVRKVLSWFWSETR